MTDQNAPYPLHTAAAHTSLEAAHQRRLEQHAAVAQHLAERQRKLDAATTPKPEDQKP